MPLLHVKYGVSSKLKISIDQKAEIVHLRTKVKASRIGYEVGKAFERLDSRSNMVY